jgi:hypothetical protein
MTADETAPETAGCPTPRGLPTAWFPSAGTAVAPHAVGVRGH